MGSQNLQQREKTFSGAEKEKMENLPFPYDWNRDPFKLEFLMGATTPMVIFHVILKCKIQNRFVINIRLTKA